jgi:hypothetical protein
MKSLTKIPVLFALTTFLLIFPLESSTNARPCEKGIRGKIFCNPDPTNPANNVGVERNRTGQSEQELLFIENAKAEEREKVKRAIQAESYLKPAQSETIGNVLEREGCGSLESLPDYCIKN